MSDIELDRHELHGMQPVLGVPSMEAAIAYYRDVLGFHVDFVAGDPPAHARLCSSPTFVSPAVFIRFEPLEAGAAVNPSVWLWLHVGEGLDELFATYVSRGVKIVSAPQDRPWGLREFVIRDCNGYTLAFCAEIAGG